MQNTEHMADKQQFSQPGVNDDVAILERHTKEIGLEQKVGAYCIGLTTSDDDADDSDDVSGDDDEMMKREGR